MTLLTAIMSLTTVTLIAVALFGTPAIVRRTLPLGVSIPAERVDEPAVTGSIRRFRWIVAVCWLVCCVLAVVSAFIAPVVGMLVPTLLMVALGVAGYAIARTAIITAKRDGDWYRDIPVRLRAEVTPAHAPRPPVGWLIASIAVVAVAAAIGVALYPGLPGTIPTHWDAAGQADGYAAKSVWSVFGVLLVPLAIAVGFFALSFLSRLPNLRGGILADPEVAHRQASAQRVLLGGVLGQMSFIVAAAVCAAQVLGWTGHGQAIWIPVTVMLVLIVVATALFFVRAARMVAAPHTVPEGPDSPDDDRHWKAGLVYVNHEDPAIFVPKRFGVGWTVNLGSAGGASIGVAILVILVGGIVLGVVAPHTTGR